MAMKIRKGDNVVVITGKDKHKEGKVLSVNVKDHTVLVEGIETEAQALRTVRRFVQHRVKAAAEGYTDIVIVRALLCTDRDGQCCSSDSNN